MGYTHAKRNRQTAPTETGVQEQNPAQGPNLDALRAGLAQPTAEQKCRRVDLPDAMRAKMEASFGADLSAVKLYESEAVADAGAQAVTRGSEIAFAPGMLDSSSFGGQALLGHELSHVVSQRSGEVTGGGFLHDAALEARADREGAMAAAGQQIAMPAAAMSAVTAAPAAGPMQAKKNKGGSKAAKKPANKPKKQKKPAKKPKNPVRASFRDMEESNDFDEETKELSLYGDGTDEPLRMSEDAEWISPELLRKFQARNNQKADKLFYLGAGILADAEADTAAQNAAQDSVYDQYLQEEMQKWDKPDMARTEAYDRAVEYANTHKKKVKKTVSAKDKKWFDQATSDPSLDLYRALHARKMKAARELVEYHESNSKLLPSEGKDKMAFETSFSEAARKLNIYDMILSSMSMTPAARELQQELLDQGKEHDDLDIMMKAEKLSTAGKTGKFAKTEEGKKYAPMFQEMQIEALKGTYLSRPGNGKKKKK